MQNRRNKSFASYERSSRVAAPAGVRKVGRFWALSAVLLVGLVFFVRHDTPQASAEQATKPTVAGKRAAPLKPFPTIDTGTLTTVQKKLLGLAKKEYYKRPIGYDETVMKYTEGVEESWCADFISWLRFEAGIPWTHPETKYWRIAGVGSVKDYYLAADAYVEADKLEGYVPRLGDVLFYFGETPDGGSSEHIAMVLQSDGKTVTTIGGNETDKSILQVRTNKLQLGERGLVAVGKTAVD